jgi:hypothetical protein
MGSPAVVGGVHVAHLFSFLCCVVLWFWLVYLRRMSCVPNVDIFSGLFILDYHLRFSLTFIYTKVSFGFRLLITSRLPIIQHQYRDNGKHLRIIFPSTDYTVCEENTGLK